MKKKRKTRKKTRTLPATLGDVDDVALDRRRDREADVARLAGRRRRRALALLDRARNAAANLEERDVGRVEVKSPAAGDSRPHFVQHGKSRLGMAIARALHMLSRGRGEVGKRNLLFTRALHVGDGLLADLERRCERADEEHRESVEESGELHLGLCGLEQAERHQKSRKDRKSKGGRYSKDRRRRQKQQLNQRRMRKKGAALLERRLNRSEERGGGGICGRSRWRELHSLIVLGFRPAAGRLEAFEKAYLIVVVRAMYLVVAAGFLLLRHPCPAHTSERPRGRQR